MPFQFKTEPRQHQLELFEQTKDHKFWGHLWEMGLGKSKIILDVAAHQYLQGNIDTLLVIAPNGVHRNWITDEVPKHLPNVGDYHSICYYSLEAAKIRWIKEKEYFLKQKGLLIVSMSYDSLLTPRGFAFAERLMGRRAMLVLDESQRIKNPSAKRTKVLLKLGPKAVIRRILSGTPITNSPFDAWSQVEFLCPGFWRDIQCGVFSAFKRYFGVFQTIQVDHYDRRSEEMKKRDVQICVNHKNVDVLNQQLSRIADRKTKAECLDLPPKVYSKVYVEMTLDQRRVYKDIRDRAYAHLQSGGLIAAPIVLTQMLRLQQVVCGFVKTEDDEIVSVCQGKNPRIETLLEILEDAPDRQAIIWARFNYDIDAISEELTKKKITHVTYDGRTSNTDRTKAMAMFRSGEARIFLAKPSAAGEGLTLTEATLVVYYSNSFMLSQRLQSEDRCHRIGQTQSVTYIDLVSPDSIDEGIVDALRDKKQIADQVTGDRWREWI